MTDTKDNVTGIGSQRPLASGGSCCNGHGLHGRVSRREARQDYLATNSDMESFATQLDYLAMKSDIESIKVWVLKGVIIGMVAAVTLAITLTLGMLKLFG